MKRSEMGIPKSFSVCGHTISVAIIPKSRWKHGAKVLGIWLPDRLRIEIRSDQPLTLIAQTFVHEKVHCLLDLMNSKLSHDEVFVDNFATLLHNSLTTYQFPDDNGKKES